MRSLSVLTIAMLALAGCASDEPAADSLEPETCVVESAQDFSCAEADANKTADQVAHVHDYWAGQSTVRLLEQTRSLGGSLYGSCDAYPILLIRPDDGATVYQGTGRMDITLEFDDSIEHRAGEMELWIKRADQDVPERIGPLEDVALDLNFSAADLPHQQLSAWEFWVYAHPDPLLDCRIIARGQVTIAVDIHKTLEVEAFPGHPDHWKDAMQRPLLAAYADLASADETTGICNGGGPGSDPRGSCQMHWNGFGPMNGTIVPPGTSRIELVLTPDPDDTDLGDELGLRYHGAVSREWIEVPATSRGATVEFEILIQDDTDGPYAEQSQWRFQVINLADHQTYQGGWTLDATAIKAT